jgi:aspartate racemase
LTGTRWLVDSAVYPAAIAEQGLSFRRPPAADRTAINRIIMDELVYGVCTTESARYFGTVIEGLREAGCDVVVLGCTEIPLLINDDNSPLPTLDSTHLLARAALRRALAL